MTDDADDVGLELPGFGRLPDPARDKLTELLLTHGAEILREASRLEERWRTDENGTPEITARDVSDAAIMVQRAPARRKSKQFKLLELFAFSATFIGGVFGNQISTPVGAVGFAICAAVGIAAYANRGDE